jgi:hypothetical protein
MTPMIRPRSSRSDEFPDSSYSLNVLPGSEQAWVDEQPRQPVKSRGAVAPDRIVNQCLELIMLAQGFVFLVAALTMLAR